MIYIVSEVIILLVYFEILIISIEIYVHLFGFDWYLECMCDFITHVYISRFFSYKRIDKWLMVGPNYNIVYFTVIYLISKV